MKLKDKIGVTKFHATPFPYPYCPSCGITGAVQENGFRICRRRDCVIKRYDEIACDCFVVWP